MEKLCPTSSLQTWHQPSKSVKSIDPSCSLKLDDALELVKPTTEISMKKTNDLQNLFINCRVPSSATNNRNANLIGFFQDHDYCSSVHSSVRIMNIVNRVSEADIRAIEKKTRRQTKSILWRKMRRSRITASMVGNICKTVQNNKLSKKIAENSIKGSSFSNAATRWGLEKEKVALKEYMEVKNIIVRSCGLFIDKEYNFVGASPDGMACDNSKIIEVKCPYSKPMSSLDYLTKDSNRQLKQNHNYFYQVQLQMYVTNVHSCDFIVWTPTEMYIQTIEYDEEFVKDCLCKIKQYFETVFCDIYVALVDI